MLLGPVYVTLTTMLHRCSNPVVAVTIPNDVYLTYSIFILTSAMRITSFPLNLRSESPRLRPKSLPTSGVDNSVSSSKSEWLSPVPNPMAYVSLLGPEPYKPPPALSRPSGLPSTPRLSLPPSSSGLMNADFMLTPDTLRYIGTTVADIGAQIHEVQLAYRAADSRVMLQKQELMRLSNKCREMQAMVEQLRGPRHARSATRFEQIQKEQKVLLGRLDRMLQGLMEKASPELSEHETKWFEELKRMKEEISGSGRYDDESLVARTRLVRLPFFALTGTTI